MFYSYFWFSLFTRVQKLPHVIFPHLYWKQICTFTFQCKSLCSFTFSQKILPRSCVKQIPVHSETDDRPWHSRIMLEATRRRRPPIWRGFMSVVEHRQGRFTEGLSLDRNGSCVVGRRFWIKKVGNPRSYDLSEASGVFSSSPLSAGKAKAAMPSLRQFSRSVAVTGPKRKRSVLVPCPEHRTVGPAQKNMIFAWKQTYNVCWDHEWRAPDVCVIVLRRRLNRRNV